MVTDYEVWAGGTVLVEGGRVADVSQDPLQVDETRDHSGHLLLPGFVDLQVNGSFGVDVATQPERLGELSRRLLATGTTSYLPTVISAPQTLYRDTLPKLDEAIRPQLSGGAEPLGVHLEGPFVSMSRRGAHPAANVSLPDGDFLNELLDLAPARMMTLAPELGGAVRLAETASGRGVVVSAGHSNAPFEIAYAAFDGWVAGVTHLFNAMSPLGHREPGLAGAAFAHPRVACGIIADGVHVHPEMVALALRVLGPDRLHLVTDAIAATGMDGGEYPLATRRVHLDESGVPRLGSGTRAGSVLTMNEAFRNVLAFTGCTLPEAARMASATPARLAGEGQRKGRLAPGFDADVAVLRPDLSVAAVYKGGTLAYESEG